MTNRNYWIGVVSRSHVRIGVKGGFIQLSHGKNAPLQKFRAGDGLVALIAEAMGCPSVAGSAV